MSEALKGAAHENVDGLVSASFRRSKSEIHCRKAAGRIDSSPKSSLLVIGLLSHTGVTRRAFLYLRARHRPNAYVLVAA
jgi:hypothetical protein